VGKFLLIILLPKYIDLLPKYIDLLPKYIDLLPKYIDIFIVVTLAGQMWAEWV
jgi:hypothetical protein